MTETFFSFLTSFEDTLWGYMGVPVLMGLGLYFSYKSRWAQVRCFPLALKLFGSFLTQKDEHHRGVHPLKAFFACVGGCVGVGNIVSICTAVQIGGPGSLFWIWVTAIIGMMVKYAEVYLGIRYRVPNANGGYNGGPMYFLQAAFSWKGVGSLAALLLCIYGVEIYQFSIIVHSVTYNWSINPYIVIAALLGLVMFASSGGVGRVGSISSAIIPVFVVLYMGMGLWVLLSNYDIIPQVIYNVITSAFSGHAALGGFVGSTLMATVSQGIRRGCYTGDVGVGYASVINSETSAQQPEQQASLEFLGIALDTFLICTTSVMLILVTGVWMQPMEVDLLVQTALGNYFPYMNFFMPFFLFLLGYSTINAYFLAGLKCANFLSPRYGSYFFYAYAITGLVVFSFIDTIKAQSVMAIAGGLLLVINSVGIFRLRHEIRFPSEAKNIELIAAID
jgi:AGCS family alanine or glycine:cation symporter